MRRPGRAILCGAALALCLTPVLPQDDPPPVPGEVYGTGTHFEIVDSDYLNVTLDSSEEVDVFLHSMGQTILIGVAAASGAASTQLTLGGLAPGATYYMQSDGSDEESFVSDGEGKYVFTRDLSDPALLTIKETSGTYYIEPGNNQCDLFGIWDDPTQTCTLTRDVSDQIHVYNMPGLTLDGNGYRVTPYYYKNPIQLYYCAGCTIKNFNLDAFYGVYAYRSSGTTITDNSIRAFYGGVRAWHSSNVIVTGNTLTGQSYTAHYPFFFSYGDGNQAYENSISDFRHGTRLHRANNNQIYNNNFCSYLFYPVYNYQGYGNAFYKSLPNGGNHWGRYDDPAEGCHDTDVDRCCDHRYYLGYGHYDEFPWTEQDAWLNEPPVADAGPDRLIDATCDRPQRLTAVTLDGSGSYDPDGDALTYSWEGPSCPTVTGVTPDADLDLGDHTITLTVEDPYGLTDSDDVTITLQDTIAPDVVAPASMQVLCTQVSAEGLGQCPSDDPGVVDWIASVVVTEACDPAPAVTDDCPTILGVDTTMVTFRAIDASGNVGTDAAEVQVLYGWGGFKPPIRDDGESSFKQYQDGRTIPVKFGIDCAGESVSAAVASIAVFNVLGGPEMTGGAGYFRYDAVDRHYIFNLSTKGYDAPATYRIEAHLDDGTVKTATFSLK